jgi:hypothetical protein
VFPSPAGTGLSEILPTLSKLRKTLIHRLGSPGSVYLPVFRGASNGSTPRFAPVVPGRTRPAESAGTPGLLFHDLRRAGIAEGVIMKIGGCGHGASLNVMPLARKRTSLTR